MFHFPYKLCLIALSSFLCFTSSFPARLSFASFSSSHLPCILICSPPVVANHKSLNTFLTEKNTGKPFQNFHHDMQPKGANESSRAPAAQNVFGKLVPCSPGCIELVHHMFLAETLSSSLLSFSSFLAASSWKLKHTRVPPKVDCPQKWTATKFYKVFASIALFRKAFAMQHVFHP